MKEPQTKLMDEGGRNEYVYKIGLLIICAGWPHVD